MASVMTAHTSTNQMKQPSDFYKKIDFSYGGLYSSSSKELVEKYKSQPKGKKLILEQNTQKINLQWENQKKVGPGLINYGNTCFLNATLQCLSYVPPFNNYLSQHKHSTECSKRQQQLFCPLCAFEKHVLKCNHWNSKQPMDPSNFAHNLRYINKRIRLGRQEDSHEFLISLFDQFQLNCLGNKKNPDVKEKESTIISQIFGGKLLSSVKCLKCKQVSSIVENFFDLSLEVRQSDSLTKSFQNFFRKEDLTGNNKYKCSSCKNLVDAQKQFLIRKFIVLLSLINPKEKAPIVLTIHLKRFTNQLNKINKFLSFSQKINIQEFLHEKQSNTKVYELIGVLVHSGYESLWGHYYAYIKAPNNL